MKNIKLLLALLLVPAHTIYAMENKEKQLIEKTPSCELAESQVEDIYNRIGKSNTQQLAQKVTENSPELIKANQRLADLKQQQKWSFNRTIAYGFLFAFCAFAIGSKVYAEYILTPEDKACFHVCSTDTLNNCHRICVDSNTNDCQGNIVKQLSQFFCSNETLTFIPTK